MSPVTGIKVPASTRPRRGCSRRSLSSSSSRKSARFVHSDERREILEQVEDLLGEPSAYGASFALSALSLIPCCRVLELVVMWVPLGTRIVYKVAGR